MGEITEELTKKLQEKFGKKVISIIYNPSIEEGIQAGDEYCITTVIEREIKKQGTQNCVILLSGSGGDFKTALLMSHLLRNNLNHYTCFIPIVAGSALCYIILHSNKLLMGESALLTQIDPIFEHDGERYRAIKHLDNQDKKIHDKSHDIFNYVSARLSEILSHKHSILNVNGVNLGDFSPIIYLFMGKGYHDEGVRFHELKKLNINLGLAEEEKVTLGKELVRECREKLEEFNSRLIIQTENGSYFPRGNKIF